jgi:hypothetical protein
LLDESWLAHPESYSADAKLRVRSHQKPASAGSRARHVINVSPFA